MKKLFTALLGTVFAISLVACGGSDDGNKVEDASNGQKVYQANCAGCHGGNLAGANGPAIAGLDVEKILNAIENGPGTMPKGLVSGQDAEDVAKWISEQK